jgi:hypothetical protein
MGGARRVGPLLKLIINQGLLYTLTSRSFNVKKLINTTFYPHASAKRLHKGGKSVGISGWNGVITPRRGDDT